jgi:hypothetical protein
MPIDNQQANLVWEKMAKIQAAEVTLAEAKQVSPELKSGEKIIRMKIIAAGSNKNSAGN